MLGDAKKRCKRTGRTGQYKDPNPNDDYVSGNCTDCRNAGGSQHDVWNVGNMGTSRAENAYWKVKLR